MKATPLAYVLKMFPRFSETFVINEILELERRGIPLVIYSLKRPAAGPRHAMLSRLNAEVVYLPESPWRAAGAVLAAQLRLLLDSPGTWLRTLWYVLTRRNWPAMKRFLQSGVLVMDARRRGVRHLHAHFATSATRVSMLAARLSPLTYSFTAHAKDIYLETQDVDLLRDKILESAFVVTVSEFNLCHLRSLCGNEAATRVKRIYNGVDLDAFQVGASPRSAGTILCVARLVEKKGVADLLKACAMLRGGGIPVHCRIVGDGPLRAELERLARELGLDGHVTFLGALAHHRVAEELRAAEVFALPCVIGSDGNRDGLPTVILEAMACRTPVVSTRVTGIPEMVEDGVSGYVVEPGRPGALAAALREVLENPTLRQAMGAESRRIAEERFSLRRNVGELSLLLMRTLSAGAPLADTGSGLPRRMSGSDGARAKSTPGRAEAPTQ